MNTHLEKTSFGRKGVDSAIVFGSGEIHGAYKILLCKRCVDLDECKQSKTKMSLLLVIMHGGKQAAQAIFRKAVDHCRSEDLGSSSSLELESIELAGR